MNLIDENIEKESEEKQKKVTKIIIIAIAVLVALVILILIYSLIKKKNTITVTVNDEKKTFNSSLFLMADKKHFRKSESGEIYISVRELVNVLNEGIDEKDETRRVSYFNDEYRGKGEDVTKCHIKTGNEYTSYVSGSPTIYKVRDNKAENDEIRKNSQNNKENENKEIPISDYEYEYFNKEGGVIYENNEIYATQSTIELGFNVKILFDEKNKSIKIYTLDGLSSVATNVIGATVVTDGIEYYNKKLLKYGYALVKSSSGDYGIQDYNSYQEGNYVLSCKYSDIKFVEGLNCLIVTTTEKKEKGILKIDFNTAEVQTLVEPVYQEINQIAEDGSLYAIKQGGKYGLLRIKDDKAETVLKCEYQTIGLENYSDFEEMENRYLIDKKYIPIKRDDKWGIATLEGKISITPQYDKIGCNATDTGKSAVCVPNLKNGVAGIIVGTLPVNPDPNAVNNNSNNNENATYTYSIINAETKQKIGFDAAEIYSTYINNEREYIMKVVAIDGSTHRINIYDAYLEPARTNKTNATSASEAGNNTTNNSNNNTNSDNTANNSNNTNNDNTINNNTTTNN